MAQLAREVAFGQTSALDPQGFTRNTSYRRPNSRSLSLTRQDVETETTTVQQQQTIDEPQPGIVETDEFSRKVRIGINASWVINIGLLVVKIVAFVLSGSYSVLASAVDSLVDTLSQAVLAVAEHQAARASDKFPIGRTRISELAVLACAAIMFISTAIVIRESIGSLWSGFHGHPSEVRVEKVLFIVLGAATTLKLGLWVYCRALMKNPLMMALAQDHLNDVMSNVAAVAGAAVAGYVPKCWYVDPIVALVMSLLIIRNWLVICWEQGQKMIGLVAPEDLVAVVVAVAEAHHTQMQLDRVTAYHHGSNVVVEVAVVLPASMSVKESHDIALELQHKIEAIEMVERAFVHVDYEKRENEEHKVERNLKMGEKDIMKPLTRYLPPPQPSSQPQTRPQTARSNPAQVVPEPLSAPSATEQGPPGDGGGSGGVGAGAGGLLLSGGGGGGQPPSSAAGSSQALFASAISASKKPSTVSSTPSTPSTSSKPKSPQTPQTRPQAPQAGGPVLGMGPLSRPGSAAAEAWGVGPRDGGSLTRFVRTPPPPALVEVIEDESGGAVMGPEAEAGGGDGVGGASR